MFVKYAVFIPVEYLYTGVLPTNCHKQLETLGVCNSIPGHFIHNQDLHALLGFLRG